ncbi:unnamed protein product [Rhizoctonia solani]|uniref:Uncharacterized protein n=1 Tax=Rhizoctonia solani TaxID=456999 RepID=A0A8H3GKD9_9AGAM|nr:unnamed protein product [Rhizoctonia solani]
MVRPQTRITRLIVLSSCLSPSHHHPNTQHVITSNKSSAMSFHAERRVVLSAEATRAGQEAVRKVSRLGTEGNVSTFRDLARGVDISTVNSALRLSLDPTTISHLTKNGSAVIKGCVYLMRAAATKDSKFASAFDFEYGYNCFRLLVATFNLCLLERSNKLGEALKTYATQPDTDMHTVISVALSSVIENQVKFLTTGCDSDSIFGWSLSTGRSRQSPLLTQVDTLVLLNLIWDLRKNYLQAMLSTPPPALSGLIFLFLRSISEQHSPKVPDRELLKLKLNELALRYLLIGEDHWNQHETMGEILGEIDSADHLWGKAPKYVDTEDSRCILQAFINTVCRSKRSKKVFAMKTPYILMRLIVLSVESRAQDLLPDVMQLSIDYTWDMVLFLKGQEGTGPLVRGMFSSFGIIFNPTHDRPYRLTRHIQGVLNAMHKEDLLDLAAVVIAGLKPDLRWSLQSEDNISTLQYLLTFFTLLNKIIPTDRLASCFQDYVLDWWKFTQYMHVNAYGFTIIQLHKTLGLNRLLKRIVLHVRVTIADAQHSLRIIMFIKALNTDAQIVTKNGCIAVIVAKQ